MIRNVVGPVVRPVVSLVGALRRRGIPDPSVPVNVGLPSLVGTPEVGSVLTFSAGSWSGYPSPSYAFQLRRDGVDIAGTSPYTVLESDYPAALSLFVTATNTEGSASAASAAVTILGNVPVNTVAPAVSGSNGLGDVLTTTTGSYDAYPASLSYTYQWTRNGSAISGATSSTYTLVAADSAAAVLCNVTPSNAVGAGPAAPSNSITVQTFTAPSISGVPTITGTATVGQLLTATAATASGNPTPTRTWQWLRGGLAISGATASTYTLVTEDGSTNVSVRQTEANSIGSAATAVSAVVAIPSADPYGPELVTNGGFASDLSGWAASGLWAWSGGSAVLSGTPDSSSQLNQLVIPPGNSRLKFDAVISSGQLKVSMVLCTPDTVVIASSGAQIIDVVNSSGVTRTISFLRNLSPINCSIDNVSIRSAL